MAKAPKSNVQSASNATTSQKVVELAAVAGTPVPNKVLRAKHGLGMAPIEATRVLAKEMPHFTKDGIDAHSLILINGERSIGMNVYNGNTGKGYDASKYEQPIGNLAAKEKEWKKKGYVEISGEELAAAHFSGNVKLVTLLEV